MSPIELLNLRKSLKMTQKAFAKLTGFGERTIQSWESSEGGGVPDDKTHQLLAILESKNLLRAANIVASGTASVAAGVVGGDVHHSENSELVGVLKSQIKEKDAQIERLQSQVDKLLEKLTEK